MTMMSKRKREWRSVRTKSEHVEDVCPRCGVERNEPELVGALEAAGNMACLVVVAAVVGFRMTRASKMIHLQIDHLPTRFLQPERDDDWN